MGNAVSEEVGTEEKIMQAAREVFVRRGFAAARMQEIADRAGINKALLHYYHRTKERLFEAIFREAASRAFAGIGSIVESDDSLEAKVEKIVPTYIDFLSSHPHLIGFIIHELGRNPGHLRELVRSILHLDTTKLQAQIDEAVVAGHIRPVTSETFMVNLIALCVFPFLGRPMLDAILGIDEAAFPGFIRQRKVEIPTFFLNGLRP